MKCRHCNGSGHIPDWPAFGQAVRAARLAKGMSKYAVALAADCSWVYVHNIESGQSPWVGEKARRVYAVVGIVA